LIRAFYDRVEHAAPSIKAVLHDVATLFALWSLENEGSVFLKTGFLSTQDLDKVTEYTNDYCKKVRDQAIGLTDAFNLSDFFINAPIGSHDGDAYRHYFDKVNRLNPPRKDKPPYYQSTMVPFFQRAEEEEIDVSELESED
jgi:acyl-CoA oxidase